MAAGVVFPLISRALARAGRKDAIALVSMAGAAGCAVFSIGAAWQSTPLGFFCLLAATLFCATGATGNVLVGMQTLAPAHMRATLVAVVVLSVTLLGLCIGPPLSAALAERTGAGLGAGMGVLGVLVTTPAFLLLAWSRRSAQADAPTNAALS